MSLFLAKSRHPTAFAMSAFGGKADIAATPLRKPLIAGARRSH